MATSSAESCRCKHQAKNGHAKGEQTQSHLPSDSVRVGGYWIHAKNYANSIRTVDNDAIIGQRPRQELVTQNIAVLHRYF